MRDRQRAQTHTYSSQRVHRGCGLVPLVSCVGAVWHAADYGYGSSALLQCVQRRLCGGSAAALRRLCGGSAAARRPWLRRLCGNGCAAERAQQSAGCGSARSSCCQSRWLVHLARDADLGHEVQHGLQLVQLSHRSVVLRRDAGHKVRAQTLRRAGVCTVRSRRGRDAQHRPGGAVEQTAARAHLTKSSSPCDHRDVSFGLRGDGRLRARCALGQADGRERRAPRQAFRAGQ